MEPEPDELERLLAELDALRDESPPEAAALALAALDDAAWGLIADRPGEVEHRILDFLASEDLPDTERRTLRAYLEPVRAVAEHKQTLDSLP